MSLVGWVTTEEATQLWADAGAPKVESTLVTFLSAAYRQCSEYAPVLPVTDPPTPVPENYKLAQVLQARALWTATRRDGDVLGFDDGSAVRVRPLDSSVKALLRPPGPRGGLVG